LKIQKPNENIELNLEGNESKTKFNPQAYLLDLFKNFADREENIENNRFQKLIEKIERIENFLNTLSDKLRLEDKLETLSHRIVSKIDSPVKQESLINLCFSDNEVPQPSSTKSTTKVTYLLNK
jgi:hypothetical protein